MSPMLPPLRALLPAVVLVAAPAAAHTFAVSSEGRPHVDPVEAFAADCLGDVEADDCDARAAALEEELAENLLALQYDTDLATQDLFLDMIDVESPRVQEIAVNYFASTSPPPETIWDAVRAFFFGVDGSIGYSAADALRRSPDDADVERAVRYQELRTAESHGSGFPTSSDGLDDTWAEGIALDLALADHTGFADDELFPAAERLLMNDAVFADAAGPDPTAQVLVAAYATDAPLDDVVAHFSAVFGEPPFPSLVDAEVQSQAISDEMTALQGALASGDPVALARFQELSEELTALTQGTTIAARLALDPLDLDQHVYWTALPHDRPLEGALLRSVAVGTGPLLDRTVIFVFAPGPSTGAAAAEGEGEGEGGDEPQGCGCALSGAGARGACGWLAALVVLRVVRRRAR